MLRGDGDLEADVVHVVDADDDEDDEDGDIDDDENGKVCADDLDAWVEAARGDEQEHRARRDAVAEVRRVLGDIEAASGVSVDQEVEILRQALRATEVEEPLESECIIAKLEEKVKEKGLGKLRTWGAFDIMHEVCGSSAEHDAIVTSEWLTRAIALDLSHSLISEFPPVSYIPCAVNLSDCVHLESLGSALEEVAGSLDLSDCPHLANLGPLERVGGDLELYECKALRSLPANLYVERDLMLEGCAELSDLGTLSLGGGHFNVDNCIELSSVALSRVEVWVTDSYSLAPSGLQGLVNLSLGSCTSLQLVGLDALETIEIASLSKSLNISQCSSLRSVHVAGIPSTSREAAAAASSAADKSKDSPRDPSFNAASLPALTELELQGVFSEVNIRMCDRIAAVEGGAYVSKELHVAACPALVALDLLASTCEAPRDAEEPAPLLTLYMLRSLASFATPCELGVVTANFCDKLATLSAPKCSELALTNCPRLAALPHEATNDVRIVSVGTAALPKLGDAASVVIWDAGLDLIGLSSQPSSLSAINCRGLREVCIDASEIHGSSNNALVVEFCPSVESIVIENHTEETFEISSLRFHQLSRLARLRVLGDLSVVVLDIQACPQLDSLPDLRVGKLRLGICKVVSIANLGAVPTLHVRRCAALEDLGMITPGADVTIGWCPRLPHLEFIGPVKNLRIDACRSLTRLPPDTFVEGDLSISRCPRFSELGEGLEVGNDIHIRECSSFRTLPTKLHARKVSVDQCDAFESVTDIDGLERAELRITDCVAFRSVQEGLRVRSLRLERNCSLVGLPCLGSSLRDLEVERCITFSSLPEGLALSGVLKLSMCIALETLPTEFVAGTLDIFMCPSLQSMPSCVFSWGLSGGLGPLDTPHRIIVSETGLDVDELRALAAENPNLSFEVSLPSRRRRQRWPRSIVSSDDNIYPGEDTSFATLESALGVLQDALSELPDETTTFSAAAALEVVPSAYAHGVTEFLRMTFESKEYRSTVMRKGLLQRLHEVMDLLVNTDDATIRESLCIRMADSGDACGDKPIWALNQMQQSVLLARARGDREALRKLGRQLMRLEVVHEHARSFMDTLSFVDDVCVYLYFEINLREELDLPVSARDMLFPNFIRIPPEALADAIADVRALTEEDFEAWLENWDEWRRQVRVEQAATLTLGALPRNSIKRISLSWQSLLGTRLKDPVRLLPSKTIWSLEELLKHWTATGYDLHNVPRSFEDLVNNLTRCI